MNENKQHPTTYKVWIEIEEFDTVTDDGHTLPGTYPFTEFEKTDIGGFQSNRLS